MNAALQLLVEEDGSQVIEYACVIALISLVLTASAARMQEPLCNMMGRLSDYFGSSPAMACSSGAGPGPGPSNPRGDGGTGTGNGNGQGNGNGKGQGAGHGNP
jgi:Flp pilus assembly pilin Flp